MFFRDKLLEKLKTEGYSAEKLVEGYRIVLEKVNIDIMTVKVDDEVPSMVYPSLVYTVMTSLFKDHSYRIDCSIWGIYLPDFVLDKATGTEEHFKISSYQPAEVIDFFESGYLTNRLSTIVNKRRGMISCSEQVWGMEYEIPHDDELLFVELDHLMKLIKKIQRLNTERPAYISRYVCHYCNVEISFLGNTCDHCGSQSPVCIICRDDPKPEEKISMLLCCSSYAHTDHLNIWLNQHNSCPYCNKSHPRRMDVIEY
ncbi:MAG: hypothetical protein INQ03_08245 [Candidatus Heimdallarchaeota archaeon]|nr:hypothetical protein [Candidatus Heimdallarchaeota archaeon]